MRLSTVGSLFLGLISLIPLIASNVWNLSQSIGLGGTSLLIIVQIALDVVRQLKRTNNEARIYWIYSRT